MSSVILLKKFEDVIMKVIKVTPSKERRDANSIVEVEGKIIFSMLFLN